MGAVRADSPSQCVAMATHVKFSDLAIRRVQWTAAFAYFSVSITALQTIAFLCPAMLLSVHVYT